jgi:hypothetical protein
MRGKNSVGGVVVTGVGALYTTDVSNACSTTRHRPPTWTVSSASRSTLSRARRTESETKSDPGVQAVDYSALVPLLIGAISDLNRKVEDLQQGRKNKVRKVTRP